MPDEPRPIPTDTDSFFAAIKGTRYEELFRDESRIDDLFVDMLKCSDNRIAREIGTGLADGTLSKGGMSHIPDYAEFLRQGATALSAIDLGAAFEEVAEEKNSAEQTASAQPAGTANEDEEDDSWQGFSSYDR